MFLSPCARCNTSRCIKAVVVVVVLNRATEQSKGGEAVTNEALGWKRPNRNMYNYRNTNTEIQIQKYNQRETRTSNTKM